MQIAATVVLEMFTEELVESAGLVLIYQFVDLGWQELIISSPAAAAIHRFAGRINRFPGFLVWTAHTISRRGILPGRQAPGGSCYRSYLEAPALGASNR